MFTNCIDDAVCQRDNEVNKILENYVEKNNERMNLNWETNSNNWDEWGGMSILKYIYIFKIFIHIECNNFYLII